MSDLVSKFFGPLDKGSCIYFLIICGLFFISLIIVLMSELFYVITNFNKLTLRNISSGVIVLFNVFIAYFVNRLLYTMCTKSLA
jgi:hypothetical protein